jgi:hypothetical protein
MSQLAVDKDVSAVPGQHPGPGSRGATRPSPGLIPRTAHPASDQKPPRDISVPGSCGKRPIHFLGGGLFIWAVILLSYHIALGCKRHLRTQAGRWLGGLSIFIFRLLHSQGHSCRHCCGEEWRGTEEHHFSSGHWLGNSGSCPLLPGTQP